jgi:hypothetical protein
MVRKKIVHILFPVLLLNFSYQKEQELTLTNVEWLLGTWKLETEKTTTFETWTKVSESTFEGVSHTISNVERDTVFTEFLRIVKMGDDIFYIPKVPGNKYPIPFKLIKFKKNVVSFENADHDFPQKIVYYLKSKDNIVITISGKENGEEKSIKFEFERVKKN